MANYVPPPAGATYHGSPDLFRAAARAAGDTFLAAAVSEIQLLYPASDGPARLFYPAFLSGFRRETPEIRIRRL